MLIAALTIPSPLRLLLLLALIGVLAWLLVTYLPMPGPLKKIIIVVAAIFMVVIAANALGVF